MIGTFIFVSVILCIKKFGPSKDGLVNCAAIAMTLYGMIKMDGAISGGCLNPAVALTQTLFQDMLYDDDFIGYGALPLYLCSTLLGGVLAGLFVMAKIKYSGELDDENLGETDEPENEHLVNKSG